jgi:hypothetical protein
MATNKPTQSDGTPENKGFLYGVLFVGGCTVLGCIAGGPLVGILFMTFATAGTVGVYSKGGDNDGFPASLT